MNRSVFKISLVIYILLILIVSTIPGRSMPRVEIWSFDKILHIIEYFILAFLAINVLIKPTLQNILLIIIFGTMYGGFNEIWQGIIASRSASIYDAIANSVGLVIGSLISVKYLRFVND